MFAIIIIQRLFYDCMHVRIKRYNSLLHQLSSFFHSSTDIYCLAQMIVINWKLLLIKHRIRNLVWK